MVQFRDSTYVNRKEIAEAILNNNASFTFKALELFGFERQNADPELDQDAVELVRTVLFSAATGAARKTLDPEFGSMILEYTVAVISIGRFLNDIYIYMLSSNLHANHEKLPECIRCAVDRNDFGKRLTEAVVKLDKESFVLFLDYLLGELRAGNFGYFKLPVMRYIYEHRLMPTEMFFMFMAAAIKPPVSFTGNVFCIPLS